MSGLPASHFHCFQGHDEFASSSTPHADEVVRQMFSQTQIDVDRATAFHDHPVVLMVINFMQKVHTWSWHGRPVHQTIFPGLDWSGSPGQFDINGLGDYGFKNDWSYGLLAKSFHNRCSNVSGGLNDGKFDSAISSLNSYFNQYSTQLYAEYFRHACRMGPSGEFVAQYRSLLLSKAYKSLKRAQLASGSWKNPSMEIFIHFVKLFACGASDAEVYGVYQSLTTGDYAIDPGAFPDIKGGTWKSYRGWLASDYLDWNDFQARNLTASYVVLPSIKGGLPIIVYLSLDFADRFEYWKPSGSCFSANSHVVMADGSTREISRISKGDHILTHAFEDDSRIERAARVAFVSQPKRSQRALYSFHEAPHVKFTETHPLVETGKDPEHGGLVLKFVNPDLASSMNPSWKSIPAIQIPLDSLVKHEAASSDVDEVLYDLVFEPELVDFSKGYVGIGPTTFTVADPNGKRYDAASEAPIFPWFPYTMRFFEHMLGTLLHNGHDITAMTSWLTHPETVVTPSWTDVSRDAWAKVQQVPLSNTSSAPNVSVSLDRLLLHDKADSEGKPDPQELADAFDSLHAQLGRRITHEIQTGWVHAPQTRSGLHGDRSEIAPILLLHSLHYLGLAVPRMHPSDTHKKFRVRLLQGGEKVAEVDVDASRQGRQTFEMDDLIDISACSRSQCDDDDGGRKWNIGLEVYDPMTELTYRGRTPLRERTQATVGLGGTTKDQHCIVDVKVVEVSQDALAAKAGWTWTRKMQFAEALGECFAARLAEQQTEASSRNRSTVGFSKYPS
ncbi:hypothetical protein FQN54_001112 [Arachnomyces sp. PD_36]|nr:hypothetical protein FQN54_001112 [Arachnomyces sp. PD_36]